jgi:thiamine monophosphate synthase
MGKLVDKLRQVGQGSGSGMGFLGPRTPAQAPRPAAVLVSLGAGDVAAAEAAVKNGADGIIVTRWKPGTELSKLHAAVQSSAVWGVEAGDARTGSDALKSAQEAGASFALIGQSAPARLLVESLDGFDYVVAVDPPSDDLGLVLLRAENLLPAQVALLQLRLSNADLASMSVGAFARLRLICEGLRFPVLVTLAGAPEAAHIRTLVRIGADGIVLPGEGVTASALGQQVQALREQLEKTPVDEKDRSPVAIGGLMAAGGVFPAQTPGPQPEREPEPD